MEPVCSSKNKLIPVRTSWRLIRKLAWGKRAIDLYTDDFYISAIGKGLKVNQISKHLNVKEDRSNSF